MFTLIELEGFVAVAEEGSFRRAAMRLNMSQPPLSRQIKKLERSLGVELIHRSATGAELTPAGMTFLTEARSLLARASSAPDLVRAAARGEVGSLGVGFTAVTAFTVLPGLLKATRMEMPEVEVSLLEAVTREQVARLVAGRLDLALARGIQATEVLATQVVHLESLALATEERHPLMSLGRPPSVADIAAYPVVNYSPINAQYLHDLVIDTFIRHDLTPRYVRFVTQVTSALAFASSGLGVALVPASARLVAVPGVQLAPIADAAPDTVLTSAVWRRDNQNPVLAKALRLLPTAGTGPDG